MPNSLVKKLAEILSATLHEHIELSAGMASQGSGSQTRQLIGHSNSGQTRYLLKTCAVEQLAMLQAEADNLTAIEATATVRVPQLIWCGELCNQSVLLLEWLDIHASGNWQSMGERLTLLHLSPHQQTQYGWNKDNYIGASQQSNKPSDSWASFFAEQRIGFQLELAARNGYSFGSVDILTEQVKQLLADHQPRISLLHGDLWSGNAGFNLKTPVVFDPASYYGDRETDLAMASLFGGFSPQFFETCHCMAPLPEGWQMRQTLYNLYHLLNHLNLFGASWEKDIHQSLQQLLASADRA